MSQMISSSESAPDKTEAPLFGSAVVPLVGDVMTVALPTVPPWITMGAARRVAALKRIGLLLVADGQRMIGFLGPSVLAEAPDGDLVSAWTGRGVASVTPWTRVADARETMLKNRINCLPVLAGAFLIGVVTRDSLERTLVRDSGPLTASRRGRGAIRSPNVEHARQGRQQAVGVQRLA
jgi:signal-transduction protein with cAMP-binding, CBS, and nucleotidyltransferase domain